MGVLQSELCFNNPGSSGVESAFWVELLHYGLLDPLPQRGDLPGLVFLRLAFSLSGQTVYFSLGGMNIYFFASTSVVKNWSLVFAKHPIFKKTCFSHFPFLVMLSPLVTGAQIL